MTLRRHGTKDLLRDLPLFADSSAEEVALVAQLAGEVSAAEGHFLVHEGHRGGAFTLLLEGTADVQVGEETVRTLGPGDYVGEIAMVVGGRRTASVIATSPVRAMTLSESNLDTVLNRSPGLRSKIEHTAWERLLRSPEIHDAS